MRVEWCAGNGHWKINPEPRGKKSDSVGDCKREVGSSVFLFSFVVEPIEILFLVGGASGWSVPAAVATVFGGGGSGRLWKNNGMQCDDGVVAPFCFPFFTIVNGRLESTIVLVASEEVEDGRGKLALTLGWCTMVDCAVNVGYRRWCTGKLTHELLGTSGKSVGKIVIMLLIVTTQLASCWIGYEVTVYSCWVAGGSWRL